MPRVTDFSQYTREVGEIALSLESSSLAFKGTELEQESRALCLVEGQRLDSRVNLGDSEGYFRILSFHTSLPYIRRVFRILPLEE